MSIVRIIYLRIPTWNKFRKVYNEMRWSKKLRLSDTLKGKKLYYQYMIKYSKRPTGTYCILPAAKKEDLLEICRSELLRYVQFYPADQLVLGIAASKREAFALVGEMLLSVQHEDGSIHIDELA